MRLLTNNIQLHFTIIIYQPLFQETPARHRDLCKLIHGKTASNIFNTTKWGRAKNEVRFFTLIIDVQSDFLITITSILCIRLNSDYWQILACLYLTIIFVFQIKRIQFFL